MPSIEFPVVLAIRGGGGSFWRDSNYMLDVVHLGILARGGQDHVDADRCSVDRDDLCRVRAAWSGPMPPTPQGSSARLCHDSEFRFVRRFRVDLHNGQDLQVFFPRDRNRDKFEDPDRGPWAADLELLSDGRPAFGRHDLPMPLAHGMTIARITHWLAIPTCRTTGENWCPECERLKEYWSTSWAEIRGQGNTAFISVPPDLTGTTPALHGVRWGALDSGIDWFIQTPLVVAIQDNRVVEARTGATDDLTVSWLLSDRTRRLRRETYAF
jgi:hypothetical protein